jgi:hypothetical protein
MRGAADCCGGAARECASVAGEAAARAAGLSGVAVRHVPRRFPGGSVLPAGKGPGTGSSVHVLGRGLRASAKFGRRCRLIREKIIGRDVAGFASPRTGGSPPVHANGGRRAFAPLVRREVFAFLHQQARQHGRRILLKPGIQQLHDLFPKIRRVAQPGELVALQGIAGGGEKKLPRRLGFVGAHGDLQGKQCEITSVVTTVNSTYVRRHCGKVCKSFPWNCKRHNLACFGLETL